jgi:hypothetical protein
MRGKSCNREVRSKLLPIAHTSIVIRERGGLSEFDGNGE